jgi:hypothetical protein
MQGNKTHQQERSIIQKEVNTKNAGKEFDTSSDLKRSEAAREAYRKGQNIDMRTVEHSMNDDPSIVRGSGQESGHNR